MECRSGKAFLGDWAEIGLATYSGMAVYRKTFALSTDQIKRKVIIDLGKVAVTSEVVVNGHSAGVRITPPWHYDISDLVRSGVNDLRITVANTLANHYSVGIPTPYVFPGQTESGLFGPVILKFL